MYSPSHKNHMDQSSSTLPINYFTSQFMLSVISDGITNKNENVGFVR
jgi:hypothetical protein